MAFLIKYKSNPLQEHRNHVDISRDDAFWCRSSYDVYVNMIVYILTPVVLLVTILYKKLFNKFLQYYIAILNLEEFSIVAYYEKTYIRAVADAKKEGG